MSPVEKKDDKLSCAQRVILMMFIGGWIIFASITLSEFERLSSHEKDELDEACSIIIIVQIIFLVIALFLSMFGQILKTELPFVVNIFWMVIHFRFETTDVIARYALFVTVLNFILLGIIVFMLLGVCCVGCVSCCMDNKEQTDEKKHLIQEI